MPCAGHSISPQANELIDQSNEQLESFSQGETDFAPDNKNHKKIRERLRGNKAELSWLMRTSYISNDTETRRQSAAPKRKANDAFEQSLDADAAHLQAAEVMWQNPSNFCALPYKTRYIQKYIELMCMWDGGIGRAILQDFQHQRSMKAVLIHFKIQGVPWGFIILPGPLLEAWIDNNELYIWANMRSMNWREFCFLARQDILQVLACKLNMQMLSALCFHPGIQAAKLHMCLCLQAQNGMQHLFYLPWNVSNHKAAENSSLLTRPERSVPGQPSFQAMITVW